MTTRTQNTVTASARQIGVYFFKADHPDFFSDIIVSDQSAELARAMIATVDIEEYIDGFVGTNEGKLPDGISMTRGNLDDMDLGYFEGAMESPVDSDKYEGSMGYVGFESRTKTLAFYEKHKIAILEVMDELIETVEFGDREQFLQRLLSREVDSGELFASYKAMVSGEKGQSEYKHELREKLILALVNSMIYWAFASYSSLVEMNYPLPKR